jgi:hypothetical protein
MAGAKGGAADRLVEVPGGEGGKEDAPVEGRIVGFKEEAEAGRGHIIILCSSEAGESGESQGEELHGGVMGLEESC